MDNLQYLKPSLQKRQKRRDKRLDEELIECYRRGSRSKQMKGYKNKLKRNYWEHAPMHESMKYMHGNDIKHFNDNLEPLIRLLARRCNRPWNKTFSELNKQMSKRTVSGLHVFNHIFDFVRIDVWIENKKAYYHWFGTKREVVSYGPRKEFYVHPINGLLKKGREVSRKELKDLWNTKS